MSHWERFLDLYCVISLTEFSLLGRDVNQLQAQVHSIEIADEQFAQQIEEVQVEVGSTAVCID